MKLTQRKFFIGALIGTDWQTFETSLSFPNENIKQMSNFNFLKIY